MVLNEIERETTIAAPIERVWATLTEADSLAKWWAGGGAAVDLRIGGAIVLRWLEHGTFHAQITALEPPHRFAFRWALLPDQEPREGNATDVTFTLTEEGTATRLHVHERGFATLTLTEAEREQHVADNQAGWEGTFSELEQYLLQPVS